MCTITTENNTSRSDNETSALLPKTEPQTGGSVSRESGGLSLKEQGRLLLLLVAFLYGSLSVGLRAVYARQGAPEPSVLSATRGWMAVVCLLPFVIRLPIRQPQTILPIQSQQDIIPSSKHDDSLLFYLFALELAVFNVGTQGLLNVGLVTTASARSAFFTQLSVVLTPLLTFGFGLWKGESTSVPKKIWISCFVALFGLYILSSENSDNDDGEVMIEQEASNSAWQFLSFGDWCCLGSAFCWSYYIYRLSDWGDRFDESKTMLAKNLFMAGLYTLWAVIAYYWTDPSCQGSQRGGDSTFCLWEGWKDPIALSILFYTAASSGALCDVLQQKAQSNVPAAESNVLLSLEPVFSALLGLCLLHEIPSLHECIGGACIVGASLMASST